MTSKVPCAIIMNASKQQRASKEAHKHSAALLRRHLQRQAAKLAVQRKHILARDDPEDVHQMRVTTRRLRAALRVINSGQTRLSAEVRWLTRKLGAVRDLDVLTLALGNTAAELRYRDYLQEHRDKARRKLDQALHTKRVQQLILELSDLQHKLAHQGQKSTLDLQGVIIAEIKHVQRTGLRAGADAPFARLHRLRIRCKRLRYQLEILDPKPGTPLGKILKDLKKLLEQLGRLQDTRVAAAHLLQYEETLAPEHADHQAIARMVARQERLANEIHQGFPQAWERFDKHLGHGLRELETGFATSHNKHHRKGRAGH
jgi:CHAD domain-containing protein